MNSTKILAVGMILVALVSTGTSLDPYTLDFEDKEDLPGAVASHVVNVSGDSQLRVENDEVTLSFDRDLTNWTSISYTKSGMANGNTEIRIYGENGSGRNDSFKEYIGTRPWMRFMSAQEGHHGYENYPKTDFNIDKGTEYRVVINRTGPWSADIRVFEDGKEVFPRSGKRIEDRKIFHIFDGFEGGFKPQRLVFKSNSAGEIGFLDDFVIRYDEDQNLSGAPLSSLLLVEPSWEKVLMASVVDRPVIVRDEVDAYVRDRIAAEDPDRIYALGDVATGDLNVTEVEESDIPEVFFPETEEAIMAGESRARQLRAAAHARRERLPLVFEDRSGLQTIELTEEELAAEALQGRTAVDHLVLASTDAPSAALAGRYAADNGAYLRPASGSVPQHRLALKRGLTDLAVHSMGFNATSSMLDGVYLTLFGAPQVSRQDPMEETVLVRDDPVDGSSFPTDMPYTDITGDGRLDLNPGRIPADMEEASALLAGSERSDRAVVASSYRKPTWPQVLLNHGGGVWTGTKIASILEERDVPTDLLVENRTSIREIDRAVRGLMFRLIGTSDPRNLTRARELVRQDLEAGRIQEAFQTVLLHADLFTRELASSGAVAEDDPERAARLQTLADAFSGALSVREMTKLLEAYLEYDLDIDREELGSIVSRLDTYNDTTELSVDAIQAILDPHPPLSASELDRRLPGAGKVVYTGAGNGSHWLLPNEDGSHLDFRDGPFKQYNGTNRYRPRVDGFLYDTSSMAAAGTLADRVLSGGAAGMVGHTAATYDQYVGPLARSYLDTGFMRGQAARRALNDLHDTWIFDPDHLAFPTAYWRHRARLNKTRASFVQYGNPETVKDPVIPELPDLEADCDGSRCTYSWRPETAVSEIDGRPLLIGLPSTPLGNISIPYHRLERTFPPGTEVLGVETTAGDSVDYDVRVNVSGPVPSEPVQYETRDLPDGRVKVIVRRAAVTYDPDGITVHRRPEVTLEVDQPARLTVDATAGTDNVTATVTGDHGGTTMIEIRNQTWRDRRTLENAAEAEWSGLAPGRYLVRAVSDGDHRLGPVRTTARVSGPRPSVEVTAPDRVEETDRFEVRVTAQNPTERRRTVTASIVPSDGIQTAAFEPRTVSIDLGPGERASRTIMAQAFLPGQRELDITAGAERVTEEIAVRQRPPLERVLTAIERIISRGNDGERFRARQRPDGRVLSVSMSRRSLVVDRSEGGMVSNLTLPDASLDVIASPTGIERRYTTPEGSATVRMAHGTTDRELTGVPEVVRERLDAVLDREREKLVRRYYWETHGSTAR